MTPKAECDLRILACLVLLVGLDTGCRSDSGPRPGRQVEAKPPATRLSPEAPLVRGDVLGAGRFELAMLPGQFALVAVDQGAVDVRVTLRSPRGETLLSEDNLYETRRPELLAFLAEEAGAYELTVVSLGAPAGEYALTLLTAPRPATAADRVLAEAYRERWRGSSPQCSSQAQAQALARSRSLFRSQGDALGEAETAKLLGQCLLSQTTIELGAEDTAATNLRRALELFEELQPRERAIEAELWNDLGVLSKESGTLERAHAAFEAALAAGREGANQPAVLGALLNLAQVSRLRGALQSARDFGLQLERLAADSPEAVWKLAAVDALGMTAFDLGDWSEAESRASDLERLAAAAGNVKARAHALALAARVAWKRGQLDPALARIDEALGLSREHGAADRADQLNLRAVVLSELGRHADALAALAAARELYGQLHDEGELAMNRFNRGAFLERSGRPAEALAACDQALAELDRLGRRGAAASAWFCRARSLLGLGRFDEAESAAQTAVARVEEASSQLLSSASRSNFQESKRRYYDLYVELLMRRSAATGLDRRELALAVSDQARARVLVDSLGEIRDGLRDRIKPDFRSKWHQLRLRSEVERTEGAELGSSTSLERELVRLEEEVRRDSPAFAALTDPPRISLARLRSHLLPPKSELLFFHLAKEQSYLWRVGREVFASYALGPAEPIEAAVRSILSDLAQSDDPDRLRSAEEKLRWLSRRVLGPIAGAPLAKRLLVVADGALTFLPFGLLPQGDPSGTLLDEHEIVMLPSVAVLEALVELRAGRSSTRREIAVVGNPVLVGAPRQSPAPPKAAPLPEPVPTAIAASRDAGSGYPSLRYAEREVEAILGRFPAEQTLRISGLAANRRHLLSGILKNFRIVHFATHGTLDSEQPERSRIVLSQVDESGREVDLSLQLIDLYGLELAADLVVAGTCKSALGSSGRGDGLNTFTRGFLYAGASSVLVSLWSVDDEATSVLMDHFYEHHLRGGLTVAAALRQAQLDLRASPRWGSPLYWAAFTLHGDPP